MSIRDDLAQTIFEAMDWVDSTDDIEQAGQDAEHLADAVLVWLGQLDPDADPELIAWHLRENANEIEKLRAALRAACRDAWSDGDAAFDHYLAETGESE